MRAAFEARRFLDEGADFRNYTYAKYGRIVLQQPGSYAWQIFDAQVAHLLRDEYKLRGATKVIANTLEELVDRMQDVHHQNFLNTIREYNDSIRKEVSFNPNIKDGRCTVGLEVNKTNWANTIEKPPFQAYSVGCGITFTFGGLKVNTTTHVLDIEDQPIPGLYGAGELIGGLYYFNYPGQYGPDGGLRVRPHRWARGGSVCARGHAHAANRLTPRCNKESVFVTRCIRS